MTGTTSRVRLLPDVMARDLTLVFCGINPGLKSAATGHHFVAGSNRFWRVLHQAGFTPEQVSPENGRVLLEYGFGLTTAVKRPTARADELSRDEFVAASKAFTRKMRRYAPRYVAFLGKPAFAVLSGQREVQWGLQSVSFGGATAWVLPNPSGLNRAFRLEDLVRAYSELRAAIG